MAQILSATAPLSRMRTTSVTRSAGIVALAVGYYTFAQIGLLVPSVGPMVCLLWPPAGLALAVLFRAGIGYWPGVWLGAFATNLDLCGPWASAIISSGVTTAAVVAVQVLLRRKLNREFRAVADTRSFIVSVSIASGIAGGVGTATLVAFDALRGGPVERVLLNWCLGDAGGIIVLGPFLLAFSRIDIRRFRRERRMPGLVGSILIVVLAGIFLYSGIVPIGRWALPATFLLMLLVARTASLYRVWPASLQIAYIAGWVVWNNHTLSGPSVYLEPSIRIYAAWAFLATSSIVAIGVASLLAERDAVERQLQTGQETYRALVHDNPALIGQFSTDGQLLFANETFRRAFSLPSVGDSRTFARSDPRSRSSYPNFFELTGLARDHKTLTLLRELDAPERPVCFETRQDAGAASGRSFRWTARAVDLSSSVVFEYHVVGLDVTEQKRAETERKALETQAIQTQQYEAIGVLAGGIAHEFNNILTGLIGNTDLALMLLPKTTEVRPMLAEVLRGAQRAAELTKQLSTYAGQTDTHPRPQSVGMIVRSCERLVEVVLPKNCSIRHDTMNDGLLAVVDESKIRQLFLSLVTNAAESLAERPRIGSIEVRVGSRTIESASSVHHWTNGSVLVPGEYVELEVTDNGCGMNATTLARIFEPFFTTKFPGRGLGMAAVLGIVQDHAGAILVQSEVERGTVVRVLLPTQSTSIDFPTPLPRSIRRSGRVTNAQLIRK
jgi:two-component system, cell cycle sensor histidine kinase and response regulator CckA